MEAPVPERQNNHRYDYLGHRPDEAPPFSDGKEFKEKAQGNVEDGGPSVSSVSR